MLNESQKKYLTDNIDKVFALINDPNLKDSTCSCCADKRELLKQVEALEKGAPDAQRGS